MYDLKLTNNDLTVTDNGELVLATTKNELARQWLQIRLKTLLKEWFLDQTQGMDWLNLLSTRNNREFIDLAIQATTVDTQYITRMISYYGELDIGTGKYIVSLSAEVEDGTIITLDDEALSV